jgi:hypothetical protein
MSGNIIILSLCILVIFPMAVFGASEVQVDGNLHLLSGGSLVFTDGTSASSTSSLCTGGCTGTVDGITKVVHGIYGGSGALTGNGFSVVYNDIGSYTITFANSFSSAPHCVVTSLGHQNDGNGYAACELSGPPSTTSAVITCFQYKPAWTTYNGTTYNYSYIAINTPLSFICLN